MATGSESTTAASSEASLLPATGSESTTAATSSSEAGLLPATGAESTAAAAAATAATAGAALPLPAATAQGLPATGAFYKLRLASGEFLRGDVKTKKGVRKLHRAAYSTRADDVGRSLVCGSDCRACHSCAQSVAEAGSGCGLRPVGSRPVRPVASGVVGLLQLRQRPRERLRCGNSH